MTCIVMGKIADVICMIAVAAGLTMAIMLLVIIFAAIYNEIDSRKLK